MRWTDGIDASQARAARIAGLAYLASKLLVVLANFGIAFRLSVPDSAVDTARNIAGHEALFRLNIACNLLYAVLVLVLLATLYRIVRPVNRSLALFAASCWMVVAFAWVLSALAMLGVLRMLGGAAYLGAVDAAQLQALARLQLSSGYDAYYAGLPFWGLASLACSYLLFKARYVPRGLAGFGVIASAWCVFCAFAFIAIPGFDSLVNAWAFDMPIFLFEVALGAWLVFKGLPGRSLQ